MNIKIPRSDTSCSIEFFSEDWMFLTHYVPPSKIGAFFGCEPREYKYALDRKERRWYSVGPDKVLFPLDSYSGLKLDEFVEHYETNIRFRQECANAPQVK